MKNYLSASLCPLCLSGEKTFTTKELRILSFTKK